MRFSEVEKLLATSGVYPPYISWFKEMELPYWRVAAKTRKRYPVIEVGGDSMRIGKTTAVKVLTDQFEQFGYPVTISKEDWQLNPYLKDSYEDMAEAMLKSQKWFAQRKYGQLEKAARTETVWLQDIYPEMDFNFALTNALMGRITTKQFENYSVYYKKLGWEKLARPDLIVYITSSDDVLVSRARKSLRSFELVDKDYFLSMKAVNQWWLAGAKKHGYKTLIVNTDMFDYAHDAKAQNKLGELVLKTLEIKK